MSAEIMEKQKSLQPGMCVAFGMAFKVPIPMYIDLPNPRPLSNNVDLENVWYQENAGVQVKEEAPAPVATGGTYFNVPVNAETEAAPTPAPVQPATVQPAPVQPAAVPQAQPMPQASAQPVAQATFVPPQQATVSAVPTAQVAPQAV